jgi:hypothetical protein
VKRIIENLLLWMAGFVLNEDKLSNEADKANSKPPAVYQCSQCGEDCSIDVHLVPSFKNEHGHRLLCHYCYSWREATKEAVIAGQQKLRENVS